MKRRHALSRLAALPAGLMLPPGAPAATEAAALMARLRQHGGIVLLRHALTDPGIGDPPGFRLGECATQRNLSPEGRVQAERIGAWFRRAGLVPGAVRSSAWCRCLETGRLAFGGAETWSVLNSTFGEARGRDDTGAEVAAAAARIGTGRFEVWVTHQINITAWTGEPVAMGEAVIAAGVRRGDAVGPPLAVWGRSRFDAA